MIGWAIFSVVLLVAACWLVVGIGRTVETLRGHSRCSDCGARLAGVGARYAGTCRRCGHAQPWVAA